MHNVNQKKLAIWCGALISFSSVLFSSKIAAAQTLPSFKMKFTNGQLFSDKDLSPNKPTVLIYFSPDCGHCQILTTEVLKKINAFKKVQIIMVTFLPVNEVVAFERKYQTSRYPNIKVGIEIPALYFKNYYRLENTPFTALFDKHKKLVISYQKETPVDDLTKHLKGL
ncbi:MAG: redoxin domain-containing protein [Bacteroidota bacterium]|nr:redoxin domain-containing protein [Bacteroidota bacterium]